MTLPTKQPRQLPAVRQNRSWFVIRRFVVWGAIVVLIGVSAMGGRRNVKLDKKEEEDSPEILQLKRGLLEHHDKKKNVESYLTTQEETAETTKKTQPTIRSNLLVLDPSKKLSLVENQILEFDDLDDPRADGAGTREPVVLRGVWNPPSEDWMTESAFLKAYGDVPYYIKDNYVQIKDEKCVAQFGDLWEYITGHNNSNNNNNNPQSEAIAHSSLLAFTNNLENPHFFQDISSFDIPAVVNHINSFSILSTMTQGQSHEFHKHGESWIAQAVGIKVWWFLPPTAKRPQKVNACEYLTGEQPVPKGAKTVLQSPGDVIWFPHDYYHATCSLSDWSVGIGRQLGPRIRQQFSTLPLSVDNTDRAAVQKTLDRCSGAKDIVGKASSSSASTNKDWKWYDGDLNKYYNDLETDHKRNPLDIGNYAVHRWMGEKRSTQVHYELIQESILKHYQRRLKKKKTSSSDATTPLNVLDAGCGLGSALMWMEQHQPTWTLHGRTLSEEQAKFITKKLPKHKFSIKLDSFDNLQDLDTKLDVIYSIEAAIHSTDLRKTLKAWSEQLQPRHGMVVLIDDFLQPAARRDDNDEDIDLFARSWLANSLYTITELNQMARQVGLQLVESRDLVAEYRIVELNYRNQVPSLVPDHKNRNHQGWMGSKYRQKLTVEGKLGYNLVVLQKM